jgi:hypothetical protein
MRSSLILVWKILRVGCSTIAVGEEKIVEGSCRLAQLYSLEASESLERAEWNPRQIRFNLSI